jgi:flavin-binding protein dodecin
MRAPARSGCRILPAAELLGEPKGVAVSVAKIIELTATSPDSFEDACRQGMDKAGETLRNIQGAWVDGQEVVVENGENVFHVHLKVTFLLD